jgi:hypothetical protein
MFVSQSQVDTLTREVENLKTAVSQKWESVTQLLVKVSKVESDAIVHHTEFEALKREISRVETSNREGFHLNKDSASKAQKEVDIIERKIEAYEAQARTLKNVGGVLMTVVVLLFSGVQALMKGYITDLEDTLTKQEVEMTEMLRRVSETEQQIERMIAPSLNYRSDTPKRSGYASEGFELLPVAHPIGGSAVPEFLDVNKMRLIFRGRMSRWPSGAPVSLVILSNDTQMASFAWDTLRISPQKFRDDLSTARSQGRVSVHDVDTTTEVVNHILKDRGGIGFVPNAQVYQSTSGITIIVVDD